MCKDKLGRTRTPAQDEALRRVNEDKAIPDGYSTHKYRITLPDDLHEMFAQMSPRERGQMITER